MHFRGLLASFSHAGRNLGVFAAERPAGQYQVGQSEQGKQLRGVFGQATITDLTMTEQAFDDMETVLDLPSSTVKRVSG